MGRRNAGHEPDAGAGWFNAQVRQYMQDLEGGPLTPARKEQIQRIYVH